MPFSRVEIVLRTEQRHELLELRDHAPQAYVREKAAAILKVAEGQAGLLVRRGRGRKPAFSPSRQHGGGCQD